MKAGSPKPVYRLRRKRGLALRREVHDFLFWLSDRLGQKIFIEGVHHLSSTSDGAYFEAQTLIAGETVVAPLTPLVTQIEPYRASGNRGPMLRRDFAKISKWVAEALAKQNQLTSPSLSQADATADGGGIIKLKS